MFKLNLAECKKCLDNMKIKGFSYSPILADFTGKNCMSELEFELSEGLPYIYTLKNFNGQSVCTKPQCNH